MCCTGCARLENMTRSYKNETTWCLSVREMLYAKPHPCIDIIPQYRGVNTTHTHTHTQTVCCNQRKWWLKSEVRLSGSQHCHHTPHTSTQCSSSKHDTQFQLQTQKHISTSSKLDLHTWPIASVLRTAQPLPCATVCVWMEVEHMMKLEELLSWQLFFNIASVTLLGELLYSHARYY